MKAFALIEILIVVVVLSLLLSLSVAVGLRFLKTAYIGSAVDEVNTILRKARDQSMSQDKDSAFGISFSSTQYILFKGNSFASRNPSFDEVYNLPPGVTASGLSEVVFAKLTGIPSPSSGNVILTSDSEIRTISINSIGRIAAVSCKGTSSACSTFADQTSCQNQAGCSWNPAVCNGTCTPCSSFNGNKTGCQNQQGCIWNPPSTCTGTCTSCPTFVTQTSCQNQAGCSWGECFGRVANCGSFSNQTSCQIQQRCVWE